MDFATKRLLYFLGLKGNLQGIASVAHPQLAVSADYRFNAIQCISLTCDEEYGCTESWKACAYSARVGGGQGYSLDWAIGEATPKRSAFLMLFLAHDRATKSAAK